MDGCKPLKSPWPAKSSMSSSGLETPFKDPTLYRSIVGALQYITITRPDISFAVNRACQRMHQPSTHDWENVKHLLGYLKGSLSDGLCLFSEFDLMLKAYSDADWAGCNIDRKSRSGFLIFLGHNLIFLEF